MIGASRKTGSPLERALPMALLLLLAYGAVQMVGSGRQALQQPALPDVPSVVAAQSTIDPANVVITMSPAGTDRRELRLLNVSTNSVVARLIVGYNPIALIRASRNELLVSDIAFGTRAGLTSEEGRLFVFDLAQGLTLKTPQPISLPQRAGYIALHEIATLSADERYLYYVKRIPCGQSCDEYVVASIDLDTRRETGSASFGTNCGYAALSPRGRADALVSCPHNASLWEVRPRGEVARLAASARPASFLAGVTGPDEYYFLYRDGRIEVVSSGIVTSARLLDGPRPIKNWSLADGRIIVGFNSDSSLRVDGALLVDLSRGVDSRPVPLPPGVRDLIPLDLDRLAVLLETHAVVISITTGSEQARFEVPAETWWFMRR